MYDITYILHHHKVYKDVCYIYYIERRYSKMVILEQETEPKLLTGAQEKLIYQLLQSKVFSKKEFEAFYRKVKKQIVTSYDGSVCLNYLLASIRFRKMFTGKHARSHAKCYLCGSRKDIVRYAELPDLKQRFYCRSCECNLDSVKYAGVPSIEEKSAEEITEMQSAINSSVALEIKND